MSNEEQAPADYKSALHYAGVIRIADNKLILQDDNDPDWQTFLQWIAAGGVPDPALPPQPPPPDELLMLDHENRLRAMEGKSKINLDDFVRSKRRMKP